MKKISFFMMLCLILTMFIPMNTAKAITFSPQLDIYSDGVYMVNLDTGDVVYSKNADKKTYPASLTKIMTAVILLDTFKDNLEALNTTKVVAPQVVFDEIYNMGASHAGIMNGEEITYIDLLYALMLPSACEGAGIIAYNICDGNTAQFVQKMNDKAKELGCNNTNFVNAHGLFDKNQVTTPEDMAKIIKYAMTCPLFMEVCNSPRYTMAATNMHPQERSITNRNQLLISGSEYYYKYAKGIKTGNLDESGRNLTSTAEKDGAKYLVITMGAPDPGNGIRYDCIDHKTLYEWAFNSLHTEKLLENKAEIGKQEVAFGKNANFVLVKPAKEYSTLWMEGLDKSGVKTRTVVESTPIAPVKNGDVIGKVELIYNGQVLFTTDAVAVGEVKRDNVAYYMSLAENFVSSNLFIVAVVVCLFVVVLYTLVYFSKRARKFKRRR